MTQDILRQSYEGYLNWVSSMPRSTFLSLMRVALILGLPGLICAIVFQRLRRFTRVGVVLLANWVITILGAYGILWIPLEKVEFARAEAGFVFLVCVLTIAVMPWAQSFFLATRAGHRALVAGALYLAIMAILMIQVLWR